MFCWEDITRPEIVKRMSLPRSPEDTKPQQKRDESPRVRAGVAYSTAAVLGRGWAEVYDGICLCDVVSWPFQLFKRLCACVRPRVQTFASIHVQGREVSYVQNPPAKAAVESLDSICLASLILGNAPRVAPFPGLVSDGRWRRGGQPQEMCHRSDPRF